MMGLWTVETDLAISPNERVKAEELWHLKKDENSRKKDFV